jgi:hypothetical protein
MRDGGVGLAGDLKRSNGGEEKELDDGSMH